MIPSTRAIVGTSSPSATCSLAAAAPQAPQRRKGLPRGLLCSGTSVVRGKQLIDAGRQPRTGEPEPAAHGAGEQRGRCRGDAARPRTAWKGERDQAENARDREQQGAPASRSLPPGATSEPNL